MVDDQGYGSSLSDQHNANTAVTTKREEEERATSLATLIDACKALEEQCRRERVATLAL
jgi:hypothetical protein